MKSQTWRPPHRVFIFMLKQMEVQTLLSNSSEYIRKNWKPEYFKSFQEAELDVIWQSWGAKFNINLQNEHVIKLRHFVETHHTIKELVFEGLDNTQRRLLHEICNSMGLEHVSKNDGKNQRNLHVWLPRKEGQWQWEFTSGLLTAKVDKKKQRQEKRYKRLLRSTCEYCGRNGLESDLVCSVYLPWAGMFCTDCAVIESDGNGGHLDDHKLEGINEF